MAEFMRNPYIAPMRKNAVVFFFFFFLGGGGFVRK